MPDNAPSATKYAYIPSIDAEVRDIARPLTEAIVIPATGIGSMSRGAARAVLDVAGPELEATVKALVEKNQEPFEPGTCFVTPSYKMARRGVKRIYHAVTMKYAGGVTSLHLVNKALRAALDRAIADGVQSLAVTGLGTGAGRLERSSVARMMVPVARGYCHAMRIKFVDKNAEFVNEIGRMLGKDGSNG